MVALLVGVFFNLGTTSVLASMSSNCQNLCEDQVYEIATIDGFRLRSPDSNMLWFIKRVDDYPSILLMNYQSHTMVQLNWSSMAYEETNECSNMTLMKLEEHPTLKGCFILASHDGNTFFILQKGGRLRAVYNTLQNQSLNVQDLRCFISKTMESTGTMQHISHKSMKKMEENSTTIISLWTNVQKDFNTTSIQANATCSTIDPPISTSGENLSIALDKAASPTMKMQTKLIDKWSAKLTTIMQKLKHKTTKAVIFHYNKKYLHKKGNSINCSNVLIVFCTLLALHSRLRV